MGLGKNSGSGRPWSRKDPSKQTKYGFARTVYLAEKEDKQLLDMAEYLNTSISKVIREALLHYYQIIELEEACKANETMSPITMEGERR